MKWEGGRQAGGYLKKKLFVSKLLKLDLWLLKFPVDSFIPIHTDTVESGRHFRLNIFLKDAEKGGEFKADKVLMQTRWFAFFRPDITCHYVTKVEKGTRYVLSFGFVLKDKE